MFECSECLYTPVKGHFYLSLFPPPCLQVRVHTCMCVCVRACVCREGVLVLISMYSVMSLRLVRKQRYIKKFLLSLLLFCSLYFHFRILGGIKVSLITELHMEKGGE